MKKTPGSDYAQRVRESTNEYICELLDANAALRRHNATLESSMTELRNEHLQLEDEKRELRRQLDAVREERRELDSRLARVELENQEFSSRYVAVEQQNNDLVNLYVAANQLHSTLDRGEVLTILQEIIINLVGSEQFAVYVREDGSDVFELAAVVGLDHDQAPSVAGNTGLQSAVGEGKLWLAEGAGSTDATEQPLACVPLRLGERVVGVIGVFGLLAQKSALEPLDFELFELLATQAATALYASGLQSAGATRPGEACGER